MSDGLIRHTAALEQKEPTRIEGVTLAQVIDNVDATGMARVQVKLPWLPGIEPWARVAVPSAGAQRGTFIIPQVGDEVLVAFNHGDVRDAYVIGCLWNGQDRPPASAPSDAKDKQIIKTPKGHAITLDDMTQTITILTPTKHKITIEPASIKISAADDKASVQIDAAGSMTLKANISIDLKAPKINIEGDLLTFKGSASATLDGGGMCEVKAGLVKIN